MLKEDEVLEDQISEDEVLEDLQYNGLKIIQHKKNFRFGTDAVLLGNFATAHQRERVIDLGTGTGIIALLMAGKTPAHSITGVEIQPETADMAIRSIALNKLTDRVKIICGDFRDTAALGKHSYHVAVSNPPYQKVDSGMLNANSSHALSRYEINCNLDELCRAASELLMNKGRFYLVHQAQRLADVLCTLRAHRLEPKVLQPLCPRPDTAPALFLIEAVKEAKSHLRWLPNIILSELKNTY